MRVALASLLLGSLVLASCGGGGIGSASGSAGTTGTAGKVGTAGTVGSGGTAGSGGVGQGGAAGNGSNCVAGRQLCGTECVDTTADPRHCGGCGKPCGTNQVCASSSCQAAGDCRQTPCAGFSYCDLSNGTCKPGCALDTQCSANEMCDITSHACVCQSGFSRCGGTCVADNSGMLACGSACAVCPTTNATTFACSGTSCVATACASGYHVCSGSCVSNSNVATCGSSCTACPTPPNGAATCDGTTCGLTCNTGTLLCGGTCATCSTTGATAYGCSGTTCVASTCTAGTLLCGGTCATCPTTGVTASGCSGTTCVATACTASTYRLCGGVCAACPTANVGVTTCSGSTCIVGTCVSGYHVCSGSCVSNTSVATCGTSCTPCPTATGGTATCNGTTCALSCPTGQRACGGVCATCPTLAATTSCGGTNGQQCLAATCNTSYHVCSNACVLNNSVDTCGAMCTPCPAPSVNGSAVCTQSLCAIACNTPLVRCLNECCDDCRLMSGACTGLNWCSDANGQCAPVQKLQPDATGAAGGFFGYRVALSGSVAVFGGDQDYNSTAVAYTGSVFTFERQADGVWKQQGSKLQPSNLASDAYFGGALALSGTRLVVGAPGGAGRGAVYVYERTAGAWVLQAKLTTTVYGENFGNDVSQDGDRVLVGVPGSSSSTNTAGAAYIFERQSDGTWPATGIKLVASNAAASAKFGVSVSISGDRALIGTAVRAAYVFARQSDGTWTQEQILTTTQGVSMDAFGGEVSLLGDRALVAASADYDKGNQAGAVYVFDRQTTWTATTKLYAPNASGGSFFGVALSQEADHVLVGARQASSPSSGVGFGSSGGSAYIFQRNTDGTWTSGAAINSYPDDVFSGRDYGYDVSLSGDYALMGAPGDYAPNIIGGRETGDAYVANWRSVLP